MTFRSDLLPACADHLKEKLALSGELPTSDREALASFICPTVKKLLDGDMGKLLRICYQIDLEEEKVKGILHYTAVGSIAMELSLALVDRQLWKLEIREKYSGSD